MSDHGSLEENSAFCALPWVHICGSVDGVWGRCCVDNTMYHDDLYTKPEEPEFRLKPGAIGALPRSRFAAANPGRTFGLEEAFNSVNMRRTRLEMLASERVKACIYCYDREDGGGESYRQKVNRIFSEMVDLPALIARTAADGSLDAFPLFLDIRFGNTCNLQCIMCGYPVSSRWGTEKRPTWAQANIDPYRDDDELWDVLRENAGGLRRVYFAGGEPFMQPGHFKMLDLLIETGAAAGIDLVYNSNLTVLPKGVFEQLARFKSVGIGASCDGVGEVFEKIRTGARWEVFVRNVREAKRHVPVILAVAPQRDNVLHLREIVDFAVAEGLEVDLTNFVHWPAELSVRNLPAEHKAAAGRYLDALIGDCRDRSLETAAEHLTMLASFVRAEADREAGQEVS
ncbi:MAG: twitch domain-containing radical SAM protein [Pseudonocardiaceae bacterium]